MNIPITTHVLDTSKGCPAHNIHAVLEMLKDNNTWELLGEGYTDADGRINNFMTANAPLSAGTHRITYDVGSYFKSQNMDSFYASVPIVFTVENIDDQYHVPLLLSPFGYSTYRGS